MIHEVQFKIDSDQLTGFTDEYLATLWHIAQANPAEDSDRAAGQLAERIGREIISRFIKSAPIPLWSRQGTDFYSHELQLARKEVAEIVSAAAEHSDRVISSAEAEMAASATGEMFLTGGGYTAQLHHTGGHIIPGAELLRRAAEAVGAAAPLSSLDDPANWFTVQDTTLPCGRVVSAFLMSRFPAALDADGNLALGDSLVPLVKITYDDAAKLCATAGVQMSRESQELAVRYLAYQHPDNWTGNAVAAGSLYQGLHLGSVNGAQAANYPAAENERTWHVLPGGEKVFGLAGNVYTWTHDDVQGDERGLVKGRLSDDSISLTTAPLPSMESGMGYRPDGTRSWSGRALVRGGCWFGGGGAGVFALDSARPDDAGGYVGFRFTKPISGL